MSRSAGPGSPVFFHCAQARRYSRLEGRGEHVVTLTGRTRPYPHRRHHSLGVRSTQTAREYQCSCGHVGWSNHIDLEDMARRG